MLYLSGLKVLKINLQITNTNNKFITFWVLYTRCCLTNFISIGMIRISFFVLYFYGLLARLISKVLPVLWTKSGNFVPPPQKQALTFHNWYPIFRLRAKTSHIELNQYKWTVYIPTLLYKRGRLNDWYYCCKCYEDEIVDCRWDLPVELKSSLSIKFQSF